VPTWTNDSRAFPRTHADVPAVVTTRDGCRPCAIDDLSGGGARLLTMYRLDPGARVRVSFSLPGRSTKLEVDGEIVRCDPWPVDGFAVRCRFDDPWGQTCSHIVEWVEDQILSDYVAFTVEHSLGAERTDAVRRS